MGNQPKQVIIDAPGLYLDRDGDYIAILGKTSTQQWFATDGYAYDKYGARQLGPQRHAVEPAQHDEPILVKVGLTRYMPAKFQDEMGGRPLKCTAWLAFGELSPEERDEFNKAVHHYGEVSMAVFTTTVDNMVFGRGKWWMVSFSEVPRIIEFNDKGFSPVPCKLVGKRFERIEQKPVDKKTLAEELEERKQEHVNEKARFARLCNDYSGIED